MSLITMINSIKPLLIYIAILIVMREKFLDFREQGTENREQGREHRE